MRKLKLRKLKGYIIMYLLNKEIKITILVSGMPELRLFLLWEAAYNLVWIFNKVSTFHHRFKFKNANKSQHQEEADKVYSYLAPGRLSREIRLTQMSWSMDFNIQNPGVRHSMWYKWIWNSWEKWELFAKKKSSSINSVN